MKKQDYLDHLVGVFGHPVAENPGVVIQEAAFRALGLDRWRFLTIDVEPEKIADAITDSLRPAGVAILIDAAHQCMTTRGVHHRHVSTITTQFTGVFKTDATLRQRFLDFVNKR